RRAPARESSKVENQTGPALCVLGTLGVLVCGVDERRRLSQEARLGGAADAAAPIRAGRTAAITTRTGQRADHRAARTGARRCDRVGFARRSQPQLAVEAGDVRVG